MSTALAFASLLASFVGTGLVLMVFSWRVWLLRDWLAGVVGKSYVRRDGFATAFRRKAIFHKASRARHAWGTGCGPGMRTPCEEKAKRRLRRRQCGARLGEQKANTDGTGTEWPTAWRSQQTGERARRSMARPKCGRGARSCAWTKCSPRSGNAIPEATWLRQCGVFPPGLRYMRSGRNG